MPGLQSRRGPRDTVELIGEAFPGAVIIILRWLEQAAPVCWGSWLCSLVGPGVICLWGQISLTFVHLNILRFFSSSAKIYISLQFVTWCWDRTTLW